MRRHRFAAMGTSVELLVEAGPGAGSRAALGAAEAEIRRLERRLSRFRPDSELNALNRAGRLAAGPDLMRVTELALAARERTGGRFDPTVHDALAAAGYDRSFELVPAVAAAGLEPPPPPCGGAVTVDRRAGEIVLGPGVRLDLGGIAKGYAVDRAASLLGRAGPCLVNAGGDLAVGGEERPEPWPVAVEVPGAPLTLGLGAGAVATSGRDRRRWWRSGEERHHLIDPLLGLPAECDLVRATVVAGCAAEAEVLAKALFLAGERGATREADALRIPAVLVTRDERVVRAGGLA